MVTEVLDGRLARLIVATCLVVCVLGSAATAQTFPKPVGRINDFAGVLDPAAEQELDALLATLEKDTTSEIAVVTIDSLDQIPVEDYANKLFNEWGIGQRGTDNGVLVLVAPTVREMRIEVGYGLEGVLPDGLAGQVIREQFVPAFRDGDYQSGIVAGVRRIASIVRRNETLTEAQLRALNAPAGPPVMELPAWARSHLRRARRVHLVPDRLARGVCARANRGGDDCAWSAQHTQSEHRCAPSRAIRQERLDVLVQGAIGTRLVFVVEPLRRIIGRQLRRRAIWRGRRIRTMVERTTVLWSKADRVSN